MAKSAVERFWAKVSKTDGCWEWTASKRQGYGIFWWGGRPLGSHRIAYEMARGEIQPGRVLDHACHNRACVNPDHLRLVTVKQNTENFSGLIRSNKSGVRGVFWSKQCGKWIARVEHHGKRVHVGVFDDISEAEAAVVAKRNELFTHNDLDRGLSNQRTKQWAS